MNMNWSAFQEDIFNFVNDPNNGSCVINAVAGSGKTTTIVASAKREAVKGISILFLSFNKTTADNIAKKCEGSGVDSKTLHSHGYRSVTKGNYPNRTFVKADKWVTYIRENIANLSNRKFENKVDSNKYCCEIANLLDKCRINLIKSGETRQIRVIADHFGIVASDEMVSIVSDILAIAYKPSTVVDYTDMVTTSVISYKRYMPKYDLIFVDEAQDLNKAQQELLLASIKPNGRFIAVGDPRQAINGFAGADVYSFAHLKELAGKELPLSVCYRCDNAMISLSKKIVPYLTARDKADEGCVARVKDLKGIKGGDMVLCRLSAPLVSLCLKMLANGISAKVKGRDIAEGLKKMIEGANAKNLNYLFDKLDADLDKLRKHLEKKGKVAEEESTYNNLKDRIDCIRVIAEGCRSINEVIGKLDNIFSDYQSDNVVNLSTIHKAKGLEADNVFIICPEKLPLVFKGQQEWEKEQEQNLCYVAYTRAKHNLTFVDLCREELDNYQF